MFYYVQTWGKLNGPFRNLLNTPGETKKPTEWERFVPDIVDAVIAYLLNIQIDPHLYSWLFEAKAATGPQRNNFFSLKPCKTHISVFQLWGNSQNTYLTVGMSSSQTDPILAT